MWNLAGEAHARPAVTTDDSSSECPLATRLLLPFPRAHLSSPALMAWVPRTVPARSCRRRADDPPPLRQRRRRTMPNRPWGKGPRHPLPPHGLSVRRDDSILELKAEVDTKPGSSSGARLDVTVCGDVDDSRRLPRRRPRSCYHLRDFPVKACRRPFLASPSMVLKAPPGLADRLNQSPTSVHQPRSASGMEFLPRLRPHGVSGSTIFSSTLRRERTESANLGLCHLPRVRRNPPTLTDPDHGRDSG